MIFSPQQDAPAPTISRATPLTRRAIPRVLSIAGTDPTGGAGVQADLKSIAANGGYGMAVVTALVAQNTRGVRSVHTPPVAFLREQLRAVSDDVAIDAVKIGMLADAGVIGEVRRWLDECRPPLVVLDPVMIATSGDKLLDPSAEQALRDLILQVDLVTPNIAELAVLLAEPAAKSWAEAIEQGKRLSDQTGVTVLVKGGHFDGAESPDALVNTHGLLTPSVIHVSSPRVSTKNTHGTGCSLSAAMATVQAKTGDWQQTLLEVKTWLHDALVHADDLEIGEGNGPIHHFHQLFAKAATEDKTEPYSSILWRDVELIRSQIFELPFIRALGAGDLAREDFVYYLAQDAVYLATYSSVLEKAATLAPSPQARSFFAAAGTQCREVELELHRKWLAGIDDSAPAGAATAGYLDHLVAAGKTENYAVLVAALLPCFWLYSDVGDRLHAEFLLREEAAEHPYSDWLETYADEGFAVSTRQAIAFTDEAAAVASDADRAAMRRAFFVSAQYELAFFDAAHHRVEA